MERILIVTITAESTDEYVVEIYDGESGDCVSKTLPYSPDEHRELDDWLGDEVYGWLDYMIEGLENGEG